MDSVISVLYYSEFIKLVNILKNEPKRFENKYQSKNEDEMMILNIKIIILDIGEMKLIGDKIKTIMTKMKRKLI